MQKNKTTFQENSSIKQKILKAFGEVGDTFKHLIKAPRALWGINVSYIFEGLAYFGVLTILGKYLSEDVGMADKYASLVYSVFTGGITFSMLFLGGVSDKIGVRKALLIALVMMVIGRTLLGASGTFFEYGNGLMSPMFFTLFAGLMIIVVGYGMYQPAAYAGVKAFTNKKTAVVGFAMLYALMNLGAFFSGIISSPVRQATGMVGVYWVFVGFTVLASLSVFVILTQRVIKKAEEKVKKDNETFEADDDVEKKIVEENSDKILNKNDDKKSEKNLLEPAVIILTVLVLGGAGGLVYRIATAETPQLTQAFHDHGDVYINGTWSKIKNEHISSQDKALKKEASENKLSLADISKIKLQIDKKIILPKNSSFAIDKSALAFAKAKIENDRNLMRSVASVSFKDLKVSEKNANSARDILRAHGMMAMVAAYSLIDKVDAEVLNSLRLRYKEANEISPIGIDKNQESSILQMAQMPSDKLLLEYARLAQQTIDKLKSILGNDAQPITVGIYAEIAFAHSYAKTIEKPGEVAKKLLMEEFIGWFSSALKQATKLMAASDEHKPVKLADFAEIKVTDQKASSITTSTIIPSAISKSATVKIINWFSNYGVIVFPLAIIFILLVRRLLKLRPDHPFHNKTFTFFIFILIPVQTLFAHNWLTLPYYINRAFGGTAVGDNFEFFSNLNPMLIFILTPLIAVFTANSNVYKIMLWGTLIMAIPTFLLALPPNPVLLIAYILLMTVGEAMWQPRFLQLVAEIAPEGKIGAYMGIAQLPWFLTKVVTGFYSGAMLANYCPQIGPQNNEIMWFFYGLIAMITPVSLFFAKSWINTFLQKKTI